VKIKPNKSHIRSLTKEYYREARRVFVKVRQQVVDQAHYTSPEELKLMVPHLLQVAPMNDYLIRLWGKVGGFSSYNIDRQVSSVKKAAKKTLSEHEARMRAYASQRSLQKAGKILTTEQEAINRVIDDVIEQSVAEGLSIPNTRNLMVDSLESELTTIERWQSERIARTECISAGNTADYEQMREEGLEDVTKEWLTSGLPNTRESHISYEMLGEVDFDYEYATGLQFPGDENGEAEEVINCRCTQVFNVK
jgi:hypothetical protein